MSDQPLFDPSRMPERDDMGFACHPDLDLLLRSESDDPVNDESAYLDQAKLREAGFEDHYVEFDGDCEDEAIRHRYFGEGEGVIGWNPSMPEGDGWLMVAVYDTEDGPYAMFVRRVGRA